MADVQGSPAPKQSGNVFLRKMGPLPMWAWMGVALLLAVLYYLYKKNQAGPTSPSGTSAAQDVNAPGGVDSSLVPQFVNQVYNQETPPAAPNITQTNINNPPATTTPAPGGSIVNEILQQGHVVNPSPGNAVIGWTIKQKSPQATQLKVVLNGPGAKNQTRYVPATATTATFKDLQAGHTYVAEVTPIDAQGQAVGGPNNVTFVTSKK